MKKLVKGILVGSLFLALGTPKVSALSVDGASVPNDMLLSNEGNKYTLTINKDISHDIVVDKGENVTLILKDGAKLSNKDKDTIEVKLGGTLTIEGNGTITNTTPDCAPLFNSGTTTIDSKDVTLTRSMESGNSYYVIANHGEMTIKNATVSEKGDGHKASLVENGYYDFGSGSIRNDYGSERNQEKPKLVIENGTFDGGMNTIKNDDNGIVTINDGTFKNNYQVVLMNWNVATINGGKFYTTEGKDKTNIYVGIYSKGSTAGDLTINGGYFEGGYAFEGKVYDSAAGEKLKVKINGGEFNYSKDFINDEKSDSNLKNPTTFVVNKEEFAKNKGYFNSDITALGITISSSSSSLVKDENDHFVIKDENSNTNDKDDNKNNNDNKDDDKNNENNNNDDNNNDNKDDNKNDNPSQSSPGSDNNNDNQTPSNGNNTPNNNPSFNNPQTGDSIVMYGGMITFGLGVLAYITKKLM